MYIIIPRYSKQKISPRNLQNLWECIDFGLTEDIIVKVSLNGVKFEVEGHFTQPNIITFNSKCIWECELEDIKRIKTDNRPIKLECFLNNNSCANGSANLMGSLLLPLRGMKIINNLTNFQVTPYWCKLNNLSPNFRQNAPQLCLMLAIIKKTIIDHIDFEAFLDKPKSSCTDNNNTTKLSSNVSRTLSMLKSQQGIFIKLLEDVGQIQVGNDPLEDCDIFSVTLTFRQIKNILNSLNIRQLDKEIIEKSIVFQCDFLGSISNKEIDITINDCFTINQKMSFCFRTSLKSLRLYFERVFYIPINLYYSSEIAIAKFNFDIASFLSDDIKNINEKESNLWTKHGSFGFDTLKMIKSPRALQPTLEFLLTIELLTKNTKEGQCEIQPCSQQFSCSASREDNISQEMHFEKEHFVVEDKVVEYLHLQQTVLENRTLQPSYSEACHESNRSCIPNKSVCAVAVNTDDQFEAQKRENINFHFIQQSQLQLYNDWKQNHIEYYENELARTKQTYTQELQALWEEHKNHLKACLEAKIMKCEQLLSQLENTQTQLNTLIATNLKNAAKADNMSRKNEASYRLKIEELEREIRCLKIKVNEKEIEQTVLKKRTDQLENKLELFQRADFSLDQLKDIMNEMRDQADRFTAIENFYKEQWLNYMQILKMNILKILNERKISKISDVNLCLDEVFGEEIVTVNANDNKSFQL